MFNLTEFITGMMANDPLMFIILFVITPLGSIAVIVSIVSWFEERKKDKDARQRSEQRPSEQRHQL